MTGEAPGPVPAPATIQRLIGVYHADGTRRGELAYWIGARLGRAHCALCDITHGLARERDDWSRCRAGLPVPFDTFHRDDQPATVRAAARDVTPVVMADTELGLVVLLGPADLDGCRGSIADMADALDRAARGAGLAWPGGRESLGTP